MCVRLRLPGSLHGHSLLWVKGINAANLQRLVDDPQAVAAISARVDSMFCAHLDPDAVAAVTAATPDVRERNGSRGVENALPRAMSGATAGTVVDSAALAASAAQLGWRQHVVPLPEEGAAGVGVGDGPGQSQGLRLPPSPWNSFLTSVHMAVSVHTHSATCRKSGRGTTHCRLAFPAGCWDMATAPLELVPSASPLGVAALATLTPHAVANPRDAHNPVYPLPKPDSRVIKWELFRPSGGVTSAQGVCSLREYLQRNTEAANTATGPDVQAFALPPQGACGLGSLRACVVVRSCTKGTCDCVCGCRNVHPGPNSRVVSTSEGISATLRCNT
jgi:hypothetical protein